MICKKWYKYFIFTVFIFICFSAGAPVFANPQDPYEPFNRAMFRFNDFFDQYIFKPVATVYNSIMPKPLATGFSNFFSNIDTVPTIFNDLLQGNFYQAASDTWRFGINSTVGILGFVDVASHIGLEYNSEDFGLTMAQWGYTKSRYLVLPFWGPSTFRDAMGMPINYYGLSLYPYIRPARDSYALYLFGTIVRRADLLNYEGFMQQAAIDKYAFIRDAYLQHRNYLIERNKQLSNPYLEKNKLEECADSSPPPAEECHDRGPKETVAEMKPSSSASGKTQSS